MPSTVLVITNDHDEHANAVIQELVRRAVPVFRFHPEEFPDPCSISMEIRDGRIAGEIRNGRHRVAFDDICAAWYRRSRSLFAPLPSLNLIKGDLDNFIKVQSHVTLTALFDSLQTLWVGQPFKLRRAEVKSRQLAAASKAGLQTPATLISNDPERAAAFVEGLGDVDCAVKSPIAVRAKTGWADRLPLTTTLPRGHTLDSVALAPTIFQPYIEKAYELRCVVMGDKIFAAKLNSQEQESTRTDWRAGKPDGGDVGHEVFDLPEPVQAALHRIIRGFEINFASIDLIVTPEGEFVFLDLNPNGQWLWLEDKLGLPLVASMADLLTTEYSPAAEAAPPLPQRRNEGAYGA
jgi:MvdD-like protein with pre-ATP grasp domain/ribosomal protein S6-L-glutamate ligase RimK-like protein